MIESYLDNSLIQRLFWPFFVVSSLIYLLLNWMFSINFVWHYDDVFICIEGMMSYVVGETSLIDYLSTYRNGHPIIMERLFSLASYFVLGTINIKFILLLSSLFPILLSFLLVRRTSDVIVRFTGHILLLSFTNSIFLWASASAVYFFPFFFMCLILFYFFEEELNWYRFLMYCLCLVLMFYSFSNSIVIIPILTIFLCIKTYKDDRRAFLHRLVPLLVISGLFLVHYISSTPNHVSDGLIFSESITSFFGSVGFVLMFCGSMAKYLSFNTNVQMILALIMGSIILSTVAFHIYRYRLDLSKWSLIAIYVYLTGGLVMIGRFNGSNYYLALDNRYEWFGVIAILACYRVISSSGRVGIGSRYSVYFSIALIGLASLKAGWNTLNLPRYHKLHENRARDFMNAKTNEEFEIPFEDRLVKDALSVKQIMDKAESIDIFHISEKYRQPRL